MSNPCKTGSPSGRCNTGSGSGSSTTLANAYNNGNNVDDQTLLLVDAKGRPFRVIDDGPNSLTTRLLTRFGKPVTSPHEFASAWHAHEITDGCVRYVGRMQSGNTPTDYAGLELVGNTYRSDEGVPVLATTAYGVRINASGLGTQVIGPLADSNNRNYLPPYDRPICLGASHADQETWHGGMTVGGTTAPVAGTLYAYPIMSGNRNSISGIMCNCATGVAGNVRLGLYTNHDSNNRRAYPGSLLVDSGDISTGTAGNKIAVISPAITLLPYTIYWLVAQFSAAPSVREWGIYSDYHGGPPMGHSGLAASSNTRTYVTHSGTYGPLPATFPATSPGYAAGGVALAWRVGLV